LLRDITANPINNLDVLVLNFNIELYDSSLIRSMFTFSYRQLTSAEVAIDMYAGIYIPRIDKIELFLNYVPNAKSGLSKNLHRAFVINQIVLKF
jgi:hypothetical protein